MFNSCRKAQISSEDTLLKNTLNASALVGGDSGGKKAFWQPGRTTVHGSLRVVS